MRYILALLALVTVATASAQDWARKRLDSSPRHQEWVTVRNGARRVKCFVVYPERSDRAPVVLLVHEIFGMSEWVMSVADRLAEHGYIAIAPDLLSGMGPGGGRTDSFPNMDKIREAISDLPQNQVVGDLNAAATYASHLKSASDRLSVAGFCWGGGQAFYYATQRPDLTACYVFYGIGPDDPALIRKIHTPVYGFYGGNDNRVTSTIPATCKLMDAAHKRYAPAAYPGAGHGFMRAGEAPDASPANKRAEQSAWKRWLALLGER